MDILAEDRRVDRNERVHAVAARERQGIHRILVCLDQSPRSEHSLPCATFLADTFGAAITLLHVVQSPHERSGVHAFDAIGWEISRREAGAYLERCEKQAAASWRRVETRLEEGHAADRIQAVERELRADLTVLGPYGEEEASGGLGTTAQQVLARAQSSVLVARFGSHPGAFAPRRILVPLDGSSRTESTLPTAVRIAKASQAELFLAHVVPELVPSGVLRSAEDLEMACELARRLESRAKAYLGELRDSLIREGRGVTTTVARCVDQPQALLEIAQREQIDLIVLSAHGSTCNPERSFGSVTSHLVEHSSVSVLVLQDLSAADIPGRTDRGPVRGSRPVTGGP
jgi:nucleotide-binding universal stress UspA family protein